MSHDKNIENAYKALIGVSIGDAFGESFWGESHIIQKRIDKRKIGSEQWLFTDDTVMSIAIYKCLSQFGYINQEYLAAEFGKNYIKDNYRGYGGTAHFILRNISEGKSWKEISSSVFDGMGSMGNGAAMRAGLIGAYFSNDIKQLILATQLSAEITHTHFEAKVGALAVALAARLALYIKTNDLKISHSTFISEILKDLPDSDTKSKINKSLSIPIDYSIETTVNILGNGLKMTAQDTVPFALWCAAQHLDNFEEALWKAVSGLGDRDTICAIVGSIVILSAPKNTIPILWINNTEEIDKSIFWKD
jgi:ADP-ribosylglycohydrolase